MQSDGSAAIYGLLGLALLGLWVWNMVLGIVVMRKLRDVMQTFENWKNLIDDLLRRAK